MDKITITLAGIPYTINPFTVGQLEALHIGVLQEVTGTPSEVSRLYWERNINILTAALSADHPEVTADVVKKMRLGSVKAVKATVDEILTFAGLIEDKEAPKPGEAPAAAAAA